MNVNRVEPKDYDDDDEPVIHITLGIYHDAGVVKRVDRKFITVWQIKIGKLPIYQKISHSTVFHLSLATIHLSLFIGLRMEDVYFDRHSIRVIILGNFSHNE